MFKHTVPPTVPRNVGFWIIWNPSSKPAPSKRFFSSEQARAVARQMASGNPGETFYVLHAEGAAYQPPAPVDTYTAF